MKRIATARAFAATTMTAVAVVLGGVTGGPAMADEGPTTNPNVNDLLAGTTQAAQMPLLPGLPGLPPVPPGIDMNTAAMVLSGLIGVQNVYNGTAPIYSNGAIAGMDNSLGIVFPSGGDQTTIGWALSLLDSDPALRDWVGSALGYPSANYGYYGPVGTVGEPLTGPSLPMP